MFVAEIRPALVMTALFTGLTGIILPLGFVGFGQIALPYQANGSLIVRDGKPVGSALLGQNFTTPGYFHPRPSATTGTDAKGNSVAAPYNAASSSGSNLGPTAKALIDRVSGDIKTLGGGAMGGAGIPADAVTTSASGLDPDISPENAALQVARVAGARHLPADQVQALVAAHTAGRLFGLFGEPHVNVLELNLALDAPKQAVTANAAR
jgi:K+-transporting ATPase ATPase C chain